MSNSLIQKKIWYWRQGVKPSPMGSERTTISELCLKIEDVSDGQHILDELKENGISADIKNTHSFTPHIEAHTAIVYAAADPEGKNVQEEENIQKLTDYISANEGIIGNRRPQPSQSFFKILGRLLNRGGRK